MAHTGSSVIQLTILVVVETSLHAMTTSLEHQPKPSCIWAGNNSLPPRLINLLGDSLQLPLDHLFGLARFPLFELLANTSNDP